MQGLQRVPLEMIQFIGKSLDFGGDPLLLTFNQIGLSDSVLKGIQEHYHWPSRLLPASVDGNAIRQVVARVFVVFLAQLAENRVFDLLP